MPQAIPLGVAIAISAVSTVYSVASAANTRRKMRKAADEASGISQMLRESAASWQYVYGERRVSGPIVFVNETDENRRHLQLVVVLAPHEIFEFKNLWFDDELITFDAVTGKITSTNYKDYGEVFVRTGAPGQTAIPMLVADNPGLWTTDHTLDGCAYVYVRLWWEQNRWFGGLPNISATIRGKKLYDPRTSTTYWCANPALIAYDQLTDTRIGAGIAADRIDLPSVIEAANICNEQVAFVPPQPTDNTPFRYSCHYAADSAVPVNDRLDDISACMAGSVVRSSGKWFIRAGAYRTPTITLTEADLVGQIEVSPRRSKMDLCNRVRGKYLSIPGKYVATDFPPYKNATYLSQDNGEELWADIDLPATVDPVQAQRLAKIHLERNRQQITLNAPVGLKGLQLMPTDTVMVTLPRYGWSAKVFEVVGWKMDFDTGNETAPMAVQLALQETAPSVYTWSAEETVVDEAPDTNLPNPFNVVAPTNAAVASTGSLSADGTWLAALVVTWTPPVDGYVTSGGGVIIRYKQSTATDWIELPPVTATVPSMTIPALAIGLAFNVAICSVNYIGARSEWVACTPDPITVERDLTAPAGITGVAFSPAIQESVQVPNIISDQVTVITSMTWTDPTAADLSHVELRVRRTNDPESTQYSSNFVGGGVDIEVVPGKELATLYQVMAPTLYAQYIFARSVDLTGNASAWALVATNPLSVEANRALGFRDLANQSSDALSVRGMKVGNGSNVRHVLARYPFRETLSFTSTGSSNVMFADLSLTNRGFTDIPGGYQITIEPADTTQAGWSPFMSVALSSSTVAKLGVSATANIPAGTYSVTLAGEIIQWSP